MKKYHPTNNDLQPPPSQPIWWDVRAVANKYEPERGVFVLSTRIKDRSAFDAIRRLSVSLGIPPEHISVSSAQNQSDDALPTDPLTTLRDPFYVKPPRKRSGKSGTRK